jgi:coproporphyrinogen III oxidase
MELNKEDISNWFRSLQDDICNALEKNDGKSRFSEDIWQREEGGGGRSRIIQDGDIFEKGGVNFSEVYGILPENIINALKIDVSGFYATGVSIVIHPVNPFVPIIHMNIRYFELENGKCWFGGGIDLTPHYIVAEDAHIFHQKLKQACDKHDEAYYPKFKNWADDYFYITHRKETRGIGGIFFDRLNPDEKISKSKLFDFVKDVGLCFSPLYIELVNRNKDKPYTAQNKNWQLIRRGRYVEFNLVYDKGTKFGLDTSGRIESILMSLPPFASWPYNYIPIPSSKEEFTLKNLKKGVNW